MVNRLTHCEPERVTIGVLGNQDLHEQTLVTLRLLLYNRSCVFGAFIY
ncbi:hypothetical protein SAMN04488134_10169 [Amphibacillus marinus]|uniref:Uncharacterized protein n=1 Tax=Amphibacillus marinus TaxID=872970 RepID=A0A1H8GHA4_9BACI|nr:hypothetical protein SAMN04488134_10169 [Amphibacillus marinus]